MDDKWWEDKKATQLNQQQTYEKALPVELHILRMDQLWLLLTEWYGHKWTTSMGMLPNQSWIQELATMSDKDFNRGLRKLKASADAWPPSLPEFKNWCRVTCDEWIDGVHNV